MNSKYQKIIKKLGKGRIKINESMAKHTTFEIGGPVDLFYEARTTEELIKAVKLVREFKIPFFILGGGSNVLFSDKGFKGMVVRVLNSKLKVLASRDSFGMQSSKIIAGAGTSLAKLVKLAARNSFSGLEFAVGIPGTIGGAVRGNAGAWQQNIGEKILRVRILDETNRIKWINVNNCRFGYRQSRFKENDEIILKIELKLEKSKKSEIEKKIKLNLKKRKKDPKKPSAGCVFINPKPDSAGRLIDQVGLKSKKIGNAQISSKHANFIVNLGGAKADDVLQLIKLAKKEVKKKFGVELEKEICLVGFDRI